MNKNHTFNFRTETNTKSPLLRPYPSWSAHQLTGEDPELVSPFRVRADRCGRLWVLDTGRSDILNNSQVIAPASLLIYDLHNDNLLRHYKFPESQQRTDSFFANIAVEDADCEDTFAYAADMQHPGLVVYSWKSQESWLIKHHYFNPDPLSGNFTVAGTNFIQSDGGLFGLALSKQQPDGFAMLYFHPLSSTYEFSVSTRILRNQTLAHAKESFNEFKPLGSRGTNGQSGAAFLDQLTGVLFYTLPILDAVACWKTSNRAYTIKSQGRVFMSTTQMVFPNDVKVDDQDRLWVLSDRMQEFEHGKLDRNQINFRVLSGPVKDVIENTACDITPAPLPEIITKLGDILRPSSSTQRPTSGSSATDRVSLTLVAMFAIGILCSNN